MMIEMNEMELTLLLQKALTKGNLLAPYQDSKKYAAALAKAIADAQIQTSKPAKTPEKPAEHVRPAQGPSSVPVYPNETVQIYTDGACSGNPGPGGYGVVVITATDKYEYSGGEAQTTNNRMELLAAITGLRTVPAGTSVELYSDSKYVVDGLSKGWAENWKANGWRKSDGKPALNPDLWDVLLDLYISRSVKLNWVKGHADNEYNNRCDELAVAESKKF